MITNDYKNGAYRTYTRKSKSGATYNSRYTVKAFFVDTLAGIAGAALILAPVLVYIYL